MPDRHEQSAAASQSTFRRRFAAPTTRYAVAGFVSAVVLTVSGSMRGWPFPSLTAMPWLFQINGTNTALKYTFLAVFFAAVAGLCWSWVRLVGAARNGQLTIKSAFSIFALWSLPICFAAPFFSGDVYVYFVDGDALLRGFSPYEAGVSAMGPTAEVYMVHPLWRDTSSMYGPLFMKLVEWIVLVSNGSVIAGVIIFRLIVVASLFGMGAAAVSLSRRFGREPSVALALALLNPLTMLHLVGGAHNDGIMLALLMGGFALGLKARTWPLRTVAIALCVCGMSFKMPAYAGVLVLGWYWAGQATGAASYWRRCLSSAVAGVAGLVMFELITLATGLGWGWLNALDVPGLAHPLLAPPNAVAMAFGSLFGVPYGFNDVTRIVATVLSVALCVWFIVRVGRHATGEQIVRATGWALLVLAWLGPAVYPWYLTWGIAIVAVTELARMQRVLMTAVVVVSFAIAPGGYGNLDNFSDWRRTILAFATVAVMAWGVSKVISINRGSAPSSSTLSVNVNRHSQLKTLDSSGELSLSEV